jgi:cytochrome c-type biogenesis protein CcmE
VSETSGRAPAANWKGAGKRGMTRRQRRLALIGAAGATLAVAVALILVALQDKIVFFRTPTEIAERLIAPGERVRLGGLVEDGSVVRGEGQDIRFAVTDTANSVPVVYSGLLPDLFREGQGVVTEGRLDASGIFRADTVLAKHDENYMPPEVVEALKRQGVWQEEGPQVRPD